MFIVTYILGMESEAATSSIRLEDAYSEYATHQRKRKKRSKVWKELEQGKNAQGEKTATLSLGRFSPLWFGDRIWTLSLGRIDFRNYCFKFGLVT